MKILTSGVQVGRIKKNDKNGQWAAGFRWEFVCLKCGRVESFIKSIDALRAAEAHKQQCGAAAGFSATTAALMAYLNDHDSEADALRKDAGFENPSGGCDCKLCEAARKAITAEGRGNE